MDIAAGWQNAAIGRIEERLRDDPTVEALAMVGSGAEGRMDAWSDLDLLVCVRPEAWDRFFPGLGWLAPLGPIFAVEQHPGEYSSVSRVCFEDMRRVDVIVTTAAALERHAEWPGLPFAAGSRLLFSRNLSVSRILAGTYAVPAPVVADGAFETLANGFWFKGVMAVLKTVRGDRLVAFHLSLELIQEVAVLAMMLRDRETGTNRHRGGVGDDAVVALETTRQPHSPDGILTSIEQSAVAFDGLAALWLPGYRPRRQPLVAWIAAARAALLAEGTLDGLPPAPPDPP